jgi:hypothetical protein
MLRYASFRFWGPNCNVRRWQTVLSRFQVHGSVHQRWQQWIKTNQMHNSLKIIKPLLYSYSALHVSGTLAPIIRSLLILLIQPPVTVCRWVGCIFQLWSVTTVAFVCLWGGITASRYTRMQCLLLLDPIQVNINVNIFVTYVCFKVVLLYDSTLTL